LRVLQAGQFVVDSLVGSDVGVADLGVELGEVVMQQGAVEFDLKVARRAHRSIVGKADLAGDADVEFQRHGVTPGKGAMEWGTQTSRYHDVTRRLAA
jgi:hypothetical protein